MPIEAVFGGDLVRKSPYYIKQDPQGFQDRAEILRVAKLENKTVRGIGMGSLTSIAARDFNCQVTNIDISAEELKEAAVEVKKEGLEQKNQPGVG